MKKLIGFGLWFIAFLLPFRHSILDTDDVVLADGRADNTIGLISFVAMVTLLFIGYWLVDTGGKKPSAEGHGH